MTKSNRPRKRIICLFNSFKGISGGDVRFVEIFARIQNVDKIVITPLLGQRFCEPRFNAKFIVTTRESSFKNIISTFFMRILRVLFLEIESNRAILYSTADFLPDVLPAFLLKRKNNDAVWVQVIHHVIPAKREGSRFTNLISHYAQRLSFFIIKRYADLIITVSLTVKENLTEIGFSPNRIKINLNGIDLRYFEKISPDNEKRYDGVFIGRLHASKGIFDLVKIWKILCKYKPLKLGIIGVGDQRTKQVLKKEIEKEGLNDNVDVLGYLDSDEAFGIIKSSTVFVFPSHEEGFGIAILEAMACGLPVAAWNLPVYEKIFSQGMLIAPMGNIGEMAKNILKLLDDSEFRAKVSKDALEMASKYSWDEIAARELSLIQSLQ